MPPSAPMNAQLDSDAFCRVVLRAHAGDDRAREQLSVQISAPDFPWYHALAILHRQGLRAAAAPLLAPCAPINVRLELVREAELEEARSVVRADRLRRVSHALDVASVTPARLLCRERAVVVELRGEQHSAAFTALKALDPAGPRPRDGMVNRLDPPAIVLVEVGAMPGIKSWGDLLIQGEHSRVDPDDIDRQAPFTEEDPPQPSLPPPPAFDPPAAVAEILAVRIGGIGDVLFTQPSLAALKACHPGARLVLMGDSRQRALWTSCSSTIDDVEPFDWDLRDSSESRRAAARARLQRRVAAADLLVIFGPLLALEGVVLERPVLELRIDRAGAHTATQLLAQVQAQGFATQDVLPRPTLDLVDAGRRADARARLQATGRPRPWVGLAIGASTVYKAWPIERFAEVARSLRDWRGATSFVAPAPAERALAAELVALSDGAAQVIEDVPLIELPPLLAEFDLMAGNDTGPTHLAAALDVPTLCLHGFTEAHLTGPIGSAVATLGGTSPFTPGCEESIRSVEVAQVLAALSRLLED